MKIPRRKNPMSNEQIWWIWVFLLPVAIILWLYFDLKEDSRIRKTSDQGSKDQQEALGVQLVVR